jgi:hypothetical protein
MWHFIGLDIDSRTLTLCILDTQCRDFNLRTVNRHPRRVIEFLTGMSMHSANCFERSS